MLSSFGKGVVGTYVLVFLLSIVLIFTSNLWTPFIVMSTLTTLIFLLYLSCYQAVKTMNK